MTSAIATDDQVDYFRARALQEQVAAGKAKCAAARRAHDQLAMMYRFKVAMLSTRPDSWAESLVGQSTRNRLDLEPNERTVCR